MKEIEHEDKVSKVKSKKQVKGGIKKIAGINTDAIVKCGKTVKQVKKKVVKPSAAVKKEVEDDSGLATNSKTPPRKTIRGRKPLPDMEIEAFEPYQKGSLFTASQDGKKSTKPASIEDSGDDDLSVGFVSGSAGSGVIDLTGMPYTSTPKVITVDTPESKTEPTLRRSPRNSSDSKAAKTVKSVEKGSKFNKEAPSAKKSLAFGTKGKGPLKGKCSTEPTASTSGVSQQSSSASILPDLALRVAQVESLLISSEMDRRDQKKEREKMEGRLLDLLEKKDKQEEVFVNGYQFCLENQKKIIQGENRDTLIVQ